MDEKIINELLRRLIRVETRLVSLMLQLGLDPDRQPDANVRVSEGNK